jgi:uncharacterized protein
MNDLVEPRTSTVHGTGVFAIAPIPDGTLVGHYTGRRTAIDGTHVLWVEDDDGTWTGVDGGGVLRFLNHSQAPNVEFDGADLHALRNIEPDEELLVDYGEEWSHVP